MVKFSEWKDLFQHSWDHTAFAFWRRYPNPESLHVLSEDTLSREVKDGKLFTQRLFTKTNKPPKWAERIISTNVVKILEESIIDPKEKTIITYTRNIGFAKLMTVVEKVVYREGEEGVTTVAERSVWVESKMYGLSRAIEAFGIDRFRKNSVKSLRGFEHVLNAMFPGATPHDSAPATAAAVPTPVTSKEKIVGAAKAATNLAKSKAETMYAAASY